MNIQENYAKADIWGFKDALLKHVEEGVRKNYISYMNDRAGPNNLANEEEPNLKIATIRFAFDNAVIINLLAKRGEFLEQGKFIESSKVE